MKQLVLSLFIIVAGAVFTHALESNYVKTTVYGVNSTGITEGTSNVVSTEYSDGLGRQIQSKLKLDATHDRTVSYFYDNAGRPSITTKPFIDQSSPGYFLEGDLAAIKAKLATEYAGYAGDANYAYSEVSYYDYPNGQIRKTGAPGLSNHIGSDHAVQGWTFGVSETNPSDPITLTEGSVIFQGGLISAITENAPYDTADVLDALYEHLLTVTPNPFGTPTHYLSVTRDPSRHLTQELKDLFGRKVATYADPSPVDGDEILSQIEYDILGHVLKEKAPGGNLISDSKFTYNTLGELIRKEGPDGTIETYEYDDAGNVAAVNRYFNNPVTNTETQVQRIGYNYDDFSRMTEVWQIALSSHGGGNKVIENFYDDITELWERSDELSRSLPSALVMLENLRGKLVASVNYNYLSGRKNNVIDLFSYNDDGALSKKYKIVPELPIQEIAYEYDKHGKLVLETIKCGNDLFVKQYNYDQQGRLSEVLQQNNGNKKLIGYDYNDLGVVDNKELFGSKNIGYHYDIRDQLDDINALGTNGLRQSISYLPNGNIENSDFDYKKGASTTNINYTYTYDNTNRLKTATATDGISAFPEYNSSYQYDAAGRIIYKKEGSSIISHYDFYQNNNRLKSAKSASTDYVYSYNGELIVDRTKRMVIVYDWRDCRLATCGFLNYRHKNSQIPDHTISSIPSYFP